MAARKPAEDFQDRYYDLFEDTIKSMDKHLDKVDDDVKDNNRSINKLSARVGKLENAVFPNQPQSVKDLPSWYRDPAIQKLIGLILGALILLISLFAALKGIKLPGVL